jgi:hypothetical protein
MGGYAADRLVLRGAGTTLKETWVKYMKRATKSSRRMGEERGYKL